MSTTTERVLFVHAHPDDETLSTGGTIATLVDAGAQVTVLTCTRGELGEVVDPSLGITTDELPLEREDELAAAMAILGVTDHRYLGAPDARWHGAQPRVYVDSGMRWGEHGAEPVENAAPDSLASAPFGEVAADIAAVIAETRPDAVVSYDDAGGYGHPDHVRVAAAAKRAAGAADVPFWQVVSREGDATVVVDAASVVGRKRAALLEYRSQLVVGDDWSAGANGEREPIASAEYFALASAADSSRRGAGLGASALSVVVGAIAGLVLSIAHEPSVPAAIASVAVVAALFIGLRLAFESRVVPGLAVVAFGVVSTLMSVVSATAPQPLDAGAIEAWWVGGSVVAAAVSIGTPGFGTRRPG